jgi:hypothetical protein
MQHKSLLTLALVILTCLIGKSQDTLKQHRRALSIQASFFNHSIAVPFHKVLNRTVHPGVQGTIEGRYLETSRSKIFQTLNLGGFHNKYNGTGFYLNTELAYRYKTKYRLFAEAFVGGGYLRTYHPTDIYVLNNSGNYERTQDKGFSSPLFSFAIGMGYDVRSASKYSFSPFIRYQGFIQTRYRPDIGVLPHAALHVGLRFNLDRS